VVDQGGASTKVWLNTKTLVYHCPGTRHFGATASGIYTTEREAISEGHRPAQGRSCGSLTGDTAAPAVAPPRPLPLDSVDGARESATPTSSSTQVWLNAKSRVYHCPGSRFYGKTSSGRYATEREAVAEGYRPAYGRSCA
jgi:hypothetical protein